MAVVVVAEEDVDMALFGGVVIVAGNDDGNHC